MTQTAKRDHKKLSLLCLLVALLLMATAFGTMAWLTKEDSITNEFTVGNFNAPDPDKPNPDPDNPNPNPTSSVEGYIVEPSWDDEEEHKLIPSGSFDKDPYVGVGPDSEAAVVYVYISNPFENNAVYFTLNEGWEAVDEYVTPVDAGQKQYSAGLFKYAAVLGPSETDNVWTTKPVFSQVVVSDDASTDDLNIEGEKDIVVSCFIHQAYDAEGHNIPAETIKNAAIAALVPVAP